MATRSQTPITTTESTTTTSNTSSTTISTTTLGSYFRGSIWIWRSGTSPSSQPAVTTTTITPTTTAAENLNNITILRLSDTNLEQSNSRSRQYNIDLTQDGQTSTKQGRNRGRMRFSTSDSRYTSRQSSNSPVNNSPQQSNRNLKDANKLRYESVSGSQAAEFGDLPMPANVGSGSSNSPLSPASASIRSKISDQQFNYRRTNPTVNQRTTSDTDYSVNKYDLWNRQYQSDNPDRHSFSESSANSNPAPLPPITSGRIRFGSSNQKNETPKIDHRDPYDRIRSDFGTSGNRMWQDLHRSRNPTNAPVSRWSWVWGR